MIDIWQHRTARLCMVHAALFISPTSCETAHIFVFDCMHISMSYHYSKYEFLGPESDLERYCTVSRCSSSSSSSLLVGSYVSEFSVGACSDFRRNIPIRPNSRYQTRYAQVGCSARANARWKQFLEFGDPR